MDDDELTAWLRLTLTRGVGNHAARKLLAAFGGAEEIFAQPRVSLLQVVDAAQAGALLNVPQELQSQVEITAEWLLAGASRHAVVTLGHPLYPEALLQTVDPPLVLYLLGRLDLLRTAAGKWPVDAIALVGSRNPTPQGALDARQFGRALCAAGFSIISGLARGVDGAAHEGALECAVVGTETSRLLTVAVMGTGLDRVYPRQHRELAHRISQHGLLLSEYPLGTGPLPGNFPKRNRIISGLARGTLVVEAALRSGSLITARLASEQGKEVFAIPGSIHNPQARGCHALIRQGAKLVENVQDVLDELHWSGSTAALAATAAPPAESAPAGSGADRAAVLHALGADLASFDALQARTGIDTARLQALLLELELDHQLARLPGGLFQRLVRA